jgi:uncharacterized repeat protein (TIGR03803 family)
MRRLNRVAIKIDGLSQPILFPTRSIPIPAAVLISLLACWTVTVGHAQAQFNYQQIHSFGPTNVVGVFPSGLVHATDGTFYGATAEGTGPSDTYGAIFHLDTNGENPTLLFSFESVSVNGVGTQQRIVAGSDGAIYAWYHSVGSSVDGGLIRVPTIGGGFSTLITAAAATGRIWEKLLEGADGKIYAISSGKLVRIARNGTGYQSFTITPPLDTTPMLVQATNGLLYALDDGNNLVSLDPDTGARQVVRNFSAFPPSEGISPATLLQASDGKLYIAAYTDTTAKLFRMELDGSNYSNIVALPASPDGTGYGHAVESLIEGSGGRLYGSLSTSARYGAGYVFSVDKDGANFTNLFNFPANYLLYDAGADVNRSAAKPLLPGGSAGIVGSTTSLATGNGATFRLNPDDSDFTTTYTFPGTDSDGTNVAAALTFGTNGFLYGTTRFGGANAGVLFRMLPNGSSFEAMKFFDYADLSQGSDAFGGMIQGSDGRLYGTLSAGGSAPAGSTAIGTVYGINEDGAGFQLLHTFLNTGADGRQPMAAPVEGPDGALYGTTYFGGGASAGVIYRVGKDGNGYTIIHRFTNSVSGQNPPAQLLAGQDGRLYGVTESGGPAGGGVVFAISPAGGDLALLKTFASIGTGLRTPKGSLIQDTNGVLYGTASLGGADGFGGLFKILTNGAGFTVMHEFTATGGDGRQPEAGLAFGGDGYLYGVTRYGGGAVNGSIFRIKSDLTGYEKLRAFTGTGTDGGNPVASLVRGSDGTLYGTTSAGGGRNQGTAFRINSPTAPRLVLTIGSNLLLDITATLGSIVRVDTTTNLTPPVAWQSLTNVLINASDIQVDLGVPAGAIRFFRAQQIP